MLTVETKLMKVVTGKLNKLKPSFILEITRYWHLLAEDGVLIMTGFDGNNYVRVTTEIEDGELDVIVNAETFGKMVAKTTTKTIKLEEKEDHLLFKGNGKYKVEIVEEEYPDFEEELPEELPDADVLGPDLFKGIIGKVKYATAKNEESGPLTGYLIDADKVVTTDSLRISVMEVEGPEDQMLITPQMMEVLTILPDEEILLCRLPGEYGKEFYYFITDEVEIFGSSLEGIEDFPDVSSFQEIDEDVSAEVSVLELIQTLDRLKIVQNKFDENYLKMTIENDLILETKSGGREKVSLQSINREYGQIAVNGDFLRDMLTAATNGNFIKEVMEDKEGLAGMIKISFSQRTILKIDTPDGTSHILAAIQEEE